MNSEDYAGSICMVGQNYASPGYARCDGSLQQINNYQVLYSVIGTIYGGDGRLTFGIPDLRGRSPLGSGQGPALTNRPLGTIGGVEETSFTLATNSMPAHTHVAEFELTDLGTGMTSQADLSAANVNGTLSCSTTPGGSTSPQNALPGTSTNSGADNWAMTSDNLMAADLISNMEIVNLLFNTTFAAQNVSVVVTDSGQGADVNVATALPTDCIEFVIALDGIFPPRP